MTDAPFTRSNLREQIKDVILQRILDGDYEPGARLVEFVGMGRAPQIQAPDEFDRRLLEAMTGLSAP